MSRSKHSLSNYQLRTCDMGQIVPIGCIPVLPGDTLGHKTNLLIRVSPLAAPVMHQVDARIHHFYCANRTLWDGWEDFITGGPDGMNTDVLPTLDPTGAPAGSLLDNFGIPPDTITPVQSLPITAYNRIFNEFYRDQDLTAERLDTDITLANCAWQKDYLTTARPWSQKGPAVSIPVGQSADVTTDTVGLGNLTIRQGETQVFNEMGTAGSVLTGAAAVGVEGNKLYADLSQATGADPIDVRRAWGLQRFMENAARFGSRYPEKMRQLGSTYKGLMDRPLYLGGGSQAVNFSEVLQTANGTDPRNGIGDMYGHGIAAMRSNKYAHRVQEHGYIISLLSVRPKTIYQNALDRDWLKQDREDIHDPYLDFIGQQEVWNAEALASHPTPLGVFGWADRYDEYRQQHSNVAGEFRDLLDYWHLARQYDAETPPVLNDSFVKCVPTKRVHNEQTQNALWIMAHHSIAAHRNIPKRATARLL